MRIYRKSYEIRVFERSGDTRELSKALLIFARNTSPAHRTQANQIQYKFANPNTPNGKFSYVGLYEDEEVIGFAMFAYYPHRRIVVIDHLTIDAAHRKHRTFYTFASLLQECIEDRCPDYDFSVAEVTTDPAFADDNVSGKAVMTLLRQVGFGRVHMKYRLANMEPKNFHHPYEGALMLRGAQKLPQIRSEDLRDVCHTILFDHYLPWFRDFIGDATVEYERHLQDLFEELQKQISSKPIFTINGLSRDELLNPPRRQRDFLGVPAKTIGHFCLFVVLLFSVTAVGLLLQLSERTLLMLSLFLLLAFSGIVALSDAQAFRVFDRIGKFATKLISRK